jgi:hypothetical protein
LKEKELMDRKNVGLLHGFLGAVLVILLVYAGEQVKTTKTGTASWLMRCAAAVSSIGVASLGFSFFPAAKSNENDDARRSALEKVEYLRSCKGNEQEYIPNKDFMIEEGLQDVGYRAAFQDMNNQWNQKLTGYSLGSLIVSSILFGVGVCFL